MNTGFLFVCVRMVASYLVHHSYCATAEAFAKSTDQAVHEELASIKNRQSEYTGDINCAWVTKLRYNNPSVHPSSTTYLESDVSGNKFQMEISSVPSPEQC